MEKRFSGDLRKVIIPDAGHFVHQEKADAVNQLILEFLEG